jgi:hypothetical protein
MPRGPAPSKKKRRSNAPTIPSTELDVAGRKGRPPAVPKAYNLRKAGVEWWKWAWGTPQALAWDKGALYVIARRAQLEDEVAALEESDDLLERVHNSMLRIIESEDPLDVPERLTYLGLLLAKLKALAGGRVTYLKEMRELDKVLGLTPKAMLDLRWEIVDPTAKGGEQKDSAKPPKKSEARKARLKLVS